MRLPAALLAFAALASAQTFRVDTLYQPTPLQGVWNIHPGDDLRWADPAFDDSTWNQVSMPDQVNGQFGWRWIGCASASLPIYPRHRSA